MAITQEFGKQASKAVGDYAGSQTATLSQQANAETDPEKKAQLQAEAAKWDEGGVCRVAMHTVVGGLALARVLMGFSAYATQSATLDFRAFTNNPLGWRKAKKSYQSDKAPKKSSIEKPLDKPVTPKPKG